MGGRGVEGWLLNSSYHHVSCSGWLGHCKSRCGMRVNSMSVVNLTYFQAWDFTLCLSQLNTKQKLIFQCALNVGCFKPRECIFIGTSPKYLVPSFEKQVIVYLTFRLQKHSIQYEFKSRYLNNCCCYCCCAKELCLFY